jgi:ribosomal-protein-alanine N-acetyltransferase
MVQIRKFRSDDLKEILEIERNSFSEPWNPQVFMALNDKPNSFFLVAQNGEDILGYAISINDNLCRVGYIMNLAVKKGYRRRGIGSKLLYLILEDYRKRLSKVFLEVRPSNLVAIRLYSKFGFKVNRLIKKFYQDGEDAYLMSMSFNISTHIKLR